MKEFVKLNNYGQLYIDRVLFESYFPIIFTCKNSKNEVFISVCCQSNANGCKWLLGKTSGKNVVKLLKNEITVRELLLNYSIDKVAVDYLEGNYSVNYSSEDWCEESIYLPKEDSYMYPEEGEFEEDIIYFSMINSVSYTESYYKQVTAFAETISKNFEPLTEALTAFAVNFEKIKVTSQVTHTLEIFNEKYARILGNIHRDINQEEYKMVYNQVFEASEKQFIVEIKSDDNSLADAA